MPSDKQPSDSGETEFFEVDSALLSEVGEKLVTSPHVALAELVKNSYDADATEVTISIIFPNGQDAGPRIEIVDNGHGMTRNDVRSYWMRIGTTNKASQDKSRLFGRSRTGAKGIGRFACRRLGRVLDLETIADRPSDDPKQHHGQERTALHFDWMAFTPGSLVTSQPVTAHTDPVNDQSTGLKLVIHGAISNEWTKHGVGYLQRQLVLMAANTGIQRPGMSYDPGFTVRLEAPDLTSKNGSVDIRSLFMDAGWGTLTAHVNPAGYAVCTLKAMGTRTHTITSKETYPSLCGTKMKLGIFVTEKSQMRDSSVASKYNILEVSREWGGVQVRHHGFRVYPYGDENDDWLELERDKARRLGRPPNDQIFDVAKTLGGVEKARRSLLNLLGMRNFFGSVEINDDNTALLSKADRMGYVVNDGFSELKAFTRFAIDWSMVWRDHWIGESDEAEAKRIKSKIESEHKVTFSVSDAPRDAIKTMQRTLKVLAVSATPRQKKSLALITDLSSYLDKTLKFTSRDLLRLRLIASTSTLTLLFAHEVKSLTGVFSSIAQEIEEISKSVPVAKRADLRALGVGVHESQQGLKELMELTHAMGVMDNDAQPIRIDLRAACQRAARRFARVNERYNIDLKVNIPEGFQIGPMLDGELLAILINTLSNSIKAVIAGGANRQIELSSERRGDSSILHIRDTGSGLDPSYFEQVFTPMNPDPGDNMYTRLQNSLNGEDSLLLGSGTGLGLSIVRGILRARDGDAVILPPTTGWNFHLEVHLP